MRGLPSDDLLSRPALVYSARAMNDVTTTNLHGEEVTFTC